VAANWPGLSRLWLAHSQCRPDQLPATAVLAVAAGHWKRSDEMNGPTKTIKGKLSSTVQHKNYTIATDTNGRLKLFFLDLYYLLLFGCFFSRWHRVRARRGLCSLAAVMLDWPCFLETTVQVFAFMEGTVGQAWRSCDATQTNDQLGNDAITRKTACFRQRGVGVAVV